MDDIAAELRRGVGNGSPRDVREAEELMEKAADEIERLTAALQRVDALNDNPARFNSEINEVVMQALEPSSHQ